MSKNDTKIEIKLSEDNMMNLAPGITKKFISTKLGKVNTVNNQEKINIKSNIYIDGNTRLSTKIKFEENMEKCREYFPNESEEINFQKLILNMNKQLPGSHTIIECGKCKDINNLEYIYLVALDNKIISFIKDNKDNINQLSFCDTNFIESLDNSFNYCDNTIFSTQNLEDLEISELPSQIKGCTITQVFESDLFIF